MQAVKYNYQNIIAEVADTKAVIANRAMFTNTGAFDCVAILARNGEIIASAPLETDVPPMESRLSFPIGTVPYSAMQLTVSLKRVIKSRWQNG